MEFFFTFNHRLKSARHSRVEEGEAKVWDDDDDDVLLNYTAKSQEYEARPRGQNSETRLQNSSSPAASTAANRPDIAYRRKVYDPGALYSAAPLLSSPVLAQDALKAGQLVMRALQVFIPLEGTCVLLLCI